MTSTTITRHVQTPLTKVQRQYYQRILDKNIGTLLAGGKSKNAAGLANVTMELRKLCNHPVRRTCSDAHWNCLKMCLCH